MLRSPVFALLSLHAIPSVLQCAAHPAPSPCLSPAVSTASSSHSEGGEEGVVNT